MFRLIISIALFSASVSATLMDRFYNWAETHKISVPEGEHEFLHLLTNWKNNDKIIDETNSKNLTYTLGHNAFSGMSLDEFAEHMHFGLNREFITSGSSLRGYSDAVSASVPVSVPTSVDWRTEGVVSPIQDQGQAGTCYSFGTSCAVESAMAIKTGVLTKLSEQQIVDCSTIKNGGPNMGVNGGQIAPTLEWIGKTGGLCTEQAYPYGSGTTTVTGTCQKTCSKVSGSAVQSVVNVKPKSDADMMTALSKTVVSIGIQADQSSFQLYKSGVFTGACGSSLDHAVALTGYGTQNGLDYYILRNSWGQSWGQSGYMLIGKGNDPATGKPYNNGAGECGLLMEGSYPVM
jgi:C1A family cysteine protease